RAARPARPRPGDAARVASGVALTPAATLRRRNDAGDRFPRVEPVPASASRSVLVRWMGIEDSNTAGFVHGGIVMKMCDEAAGLAAVRHSHLRVVTAGVDRMTF